MSSAIRRRPPLLVAALIFGLLAGPTLCRWLLPEPGTPVPWDMPGQWIAASSDATPVGYFRKSFDVPAGVSTAWIAVAARDAYELSVNGVVLGSQSLWRPNRAFQFASSERGQRINDARPIAGVPYPREYQWEPQANERVPIFHDLSHHLQPGRNVVCIRVDSRRAGHSLRLAGEISTLAGEHLSLASDAAWKTTPLAQPESGVEWTERNYNALAWTAAVRCKGPADFFRALDPAVFAEPFAGRGLSVRRAIENAPVTFETTWQLAEAPREAWLRVAVNRAYDLSINGKKVETQMLGPSGLSAGAWIAHTLFATGQRWQPASLDPDDAGSLFNDEADERSGAMAPTTLLRDAQVGAYEAYEVSALLHAGANRVSIRLIDRGAHLEWSPRVSVDGLASGHATISRVASSASSWTARSDAMPLAIMETGEPAAQARGQQLRYLGGAAASARWAEWMLAIGVALLAVAIARFLDRRISAETAARAAASLFVAASVLASAWVLDRCFAVRDEALSMAQPRTWAAIFFAAGSAGIATWLRRRRFAHSRIWTHLALAGVLAICGISRAYRADFQPTDADEWASLQTILAIVDTGTPKLTDEAYYTRSPLYHYLTAGSVAVFGPTFWAVRLPGALFAVATCALIYLCGARLLRSRWVGLGAALLFAVHPLAIDMGHQIRFYQQQQFFALLTFYFFCRGFVGRPRMSARYWMLAAFFAAVFSQEISVMMAATLLPAYVLFAPRVAWREEAKWLIAGGCGMVFVVLDFVIFQTVCLTRLEGVSPRIEPALGLNFMYPSTLYWIFSLFSRLHVGLSLLFFAGLPFVLRARNRHAHTMLLTFCCGLVLTTILITGTGVRFQYWLFPLFFLITVHGARLLAVAVFRRLRPWLAGEFCGAEGVFASVLVLMVVLSWSPWKIPGSYETKILPDVDGAFAFVRQNLAAGDALAVAAPHTAAAKCEIGRVDYDLELPLLYDFVYRKDGRLVDRNGEAQVIARVDEFQDAIAQHQRVWVVLNRDIRFRSPGTRIAWQSPGARFDLFVRTNLQLVHQTYLTDVFLWDQSRGHLRGFRRTL